MLEKTGCEYLDFDLLYRYKGYGQPPAVQEYYAFLDRLSTTLNNNPAKNYVLDGYLILDKHFSYLKKKLKYHTIDSRLVFANYQIILERGVRLKQGSRLTKERILSIYREYINSWSFDMFVEGVERNPCVKNVQEVMRKVEWEK